MVPVGRSSHCVLRQPINELPNQLLERILFAVLGLLEFQRKIAVVEGQGSGAQLRVGLSSRKQQLAMLGDPIRAPFGGFLSERPRQWASRVPFPSTVPCTHEAEHTTSA